MLCCNMLQPVLENHVSWMSCHKTDCNVSALHEKQQMIVRLVWIHAHCTEYIVDLTCHPFACKNSTSMALWRKSCCCPSLLIASWCALLSRLCTSLISCCITWGFMSMCSWSILPGKVKHAVGRNKVREETNSFLLI